jgi:biopolymer transport protein ExbB/TolQ
MYRTASFIRPDWTPATIALMVLGFVVFWPLGLAMLAYILFGERLHAFKREANQRVDGFAQACGSGRWRSKGGFQSTTGNMAFDDWRKAEFDRIDEERRKLDEMRADFDSYLRELRRARDQEEFDRFMREREARRQQMYNPGSDYSG